MVNGDLRRKREEAKRKLLQDAGLDMAPTPLDSVQNSPNTLSEAPQEQNITNESKTSQKPKRELITVPTALRDTDTGELTGVAFPGDRSSVLNATPAEVRAILNKERDKASYRTDLDYQDTILLQAGTSPPGSSLFSLPGGVQDITQIQAQRQREQAIQSLGVIPNPELKDLSPFTDQVIQDIPIVGASLASLNSIGVKIPGVVIPSLFEKFKGQNVPMPNDVLRQRGLNEIQRGVVNETKKETDKMGVLLESIPLLNLIPYVGSQAQQVAGISTTTPATDIRTLTSNIKLQRERAELYATMVNENTLDPVIAISAINDISNQIDIMEAQLIAKINLSTKLRADPEQVRLLEQEILQVRTKLFYASNRARGRALTVPSDIQIYERLKEYEKYL